MKGAGVTSKTSCSSEDLSTCLRQGGQGHRITASDAVRVSGCRLRVSGVKITRSQRDKMHAATASLNLVCVSGFPFGIRGFRLRGWRYRDPDSDFGIRVVPANDVIEAQVDVEVVPHRPFRVGVLRDVRQRREHPVRCPRA